MSTPATISDVKALKSVSIFLTYTESVMALLIFGILILLVWENRRDRYRQDLAKTVAQLDIASSQFENFFSENYQLSIRSAERWLMEHQNWIFGWILRMNYGPANCSEIQTALKEEPLIALPKPAKKKKSMPRTQVHKLNSETEP